MKRWRLVLILSVLIPSAVFAESSRPKMTGDGWFRAVAAGAIGDNLYLFLNEGSVYRRFMTNGKAADEKIDQGWKDVKIVASNGKRLLVLLNSGSLFACAEDAGGTFRYSRLSDGWKKTMIITSVGETFVLVQENGTLYELSF